MSAGLHWPPAAASVVSWKGEHPSGTGKGGSICIPQAHPRNMGEGRGEAAGCAGEGLGASWDFGAEAGNMLGASVAWMSSLQQCLCSQQQAGKHDAKLLLGYIRVTAADCSD